MYCEGLLSFKMSSRKSRNLNLFVGMVKWGLVKVGFGGFGGFGNE